ncbi:RHS repeat domain-containing protein [Snodgrassella alvi]|uniref:RHS repeat domain-containing protein n=1 Tax=Snodgrassella alvi TaxID=1196083 RepID=UPI001C0B9BB8
MRIEQLNHTERYGYVYDALGRRIEKHRPDRDGKPCNRTTFLWDGLQMIQESGADKRQSLYLYTDEGSYEPLARIDRTGNQEQHIYYFHTDLNGMPEELTDEAGEIVWECSYQLWGKPIQEITHREIQQNLRYQGQYLDRETGLHYNTFRYYDSDTGRFTQPDPIGLQGGFNLYQYAPNPLMWIDPKGLKSCFTNAKAQSNAEKIIEKHGGIKTGENRYQMPNRRAARQAASELSGNLGSNPKVIRKSEFEGGPYSWKNSNGKIGMKSADGNNGWRDDVLGHPHLGAGPHVNVWNKSKGISHNLHLDY